jgi:2-dehydro-3-deoxygalactonokinase
VSGAALIGVDWGTSNFRAFLLDSAGTILDRRAGPNGIMTVTDGKFGLVLTARIGEWLADGALPILMSGMIGSRQGWVEAPYVSTPAGLADLAASLAPVPFDAADVRIVPGLRTEHDTRSDVIRGEETQVFGALAVLGVDGGRFLLPGTHSKWVVVEQGKVVRFATYMTGEIFAAACDHTILGRLMHDSRRRDEAFTKGVALGAWPGTPGALLSRLFAVRTAGLFSTLQAEELSDYLSGLLIGAEMADAVTADRHAIGIVASESLAERYHAAADILGVGASVVPSDCIAAGYVAIAGAAGLIGAA